MGFMPTQCDVIVIGAGTGGAVAAIRASQLGKKVAVVEKQKALGGTCLIWGCIPTKALLEHAHALKVVQNAKEWGVMLPYGAPAIDMNQVHARKDKIVSGLTKGIEFLFKKNKIDWIKGTARLLGKGKVDVFEGDKQTLEAKEIIVATGSAPRSVPAVEIDHDRIITSDEAIHLKCRSRWSSWGAVRSASSSHRSSGASAAKSRSSSCCRVSCRSKTKPCRRSSRNRSRSRASMCSRRRR